MKRWLEKDGGSLLSDGDITGWIFVSEDEYSAFTSSIIHDAMIGRYRILLICDPEKRDNTASFLAEENIDFDDLVSKGVIICPAGFSRCEGEAPGAEEFIWLLDHETAEAERSGYSSLFVLADTRCILGESPEESRIYEFESAASRFIEGKRCVLVTGIDRTRNSPSSLIQLTEYSKDLIINGKIMENPCYIPSEEVPAGKRDSARFDFMLENITAFNEYRAGLENKVLLLEERKKEIDTLLPELRRLKKIVNNSPAVAFLWGASEGWPVIFVSQNVSNFGYNPVDFYSGKTVFSDIIHPDDVNRVEREIEQHLKEGRIEYTQEYRILTSTGEVRWVDDRTIVHRESSGKPVLYEGVLMDITESKELEKELSLSNEKYSTLFAMNPDAIIVSTVDNGTILEVNDRCLDLTGLTREELVGKSILDIAFYKHPEDRVAYIGELLEKGSVLLYSIELSGSGGRTIYAEMSGMLVEIGKERCVLTIIHDVTEQRLVQERIKESEERFRAVSEAAIDSIIIIEDDSAVVFWNNAAERMFGYSSEEILGRRFIDTVVPEQLKSKPESVFHALKEGREHPFLNSIVNFTLRRKDGTEFPVEVSTSAVAIKNSWFIVAIIRDVTERRKYEEKLKISSEKFKNTFNSIQDALYIVDKEYNIVNINRAVLKILGLDRNEAVGKKCYEVFQGIDHPCENCPEVEVMKTKNPHRTELSIRVAENVTRHFDVLGSPIFNMEGEMILVVLSGRDITEMKEYRSAIEEANRKLNLLSQITRHDILNSLTISIGYLNMLKEEIPPGSEEYFSRLTLSIDTIKRQIEFTRDYQDMGISPPEWQKVTPLLQACRYQGGGLPDDAEFSLDVRDIEIFADPMFEKALCNIITNAYKHATGMKSLRIYEKEKNGGLLLFFEDDGPGIEEDRKGSIFKPGYGREHGYGLFLVKEILGITGIEISETGIQGKGARFEIVVPSGKWHVKE